MRCARLMIAVTLALFFGAASVADELYTAPRQKGTPGARSAQPWADVVGSTVVAEGVAWGFYDKGFGAYVILDGSRVYVEGLDKARDTLQGKLIRVSGVLTVYKQPAAPPNSQGTGREVIVYTIKRANWKPIDRIEWPYLDVVETRK
jgi:hypothetical protein